MTLLAGRFSRKEHMRFHRGAVDVVAQSARGQDLRSMCVNLHERVRAVTREACVGPLEMKAAAPGQFVALRIGGCW
jgi:hypothetical protein